MTSDAGLLAIEIDTLWVSDFAGRLLHTREDEPAAAPDFVLARSESEVVFASSPRVSPLFARELEALVCAHSPGSVDSLRARLEADFGPMTTANGVSYLVEGRLPFSLGPNVVTSSDSPAMLHPPRGANWSDDEWGPLLAGKLGPWAAVVVEDETSALCHTARLAPRGAEAGVFTAPAHRGRGLAAVATAAWASQFKGDERRLFYSTSRAAARLGLREIGRMWQFFGPAVHVSHV